MPELSKYLMSIFDNYSKGASMRKIIAFVTGVVFAAWLHYKWVDANNAFQFLMADLACALLCLGIITMEQVIKFKNGGANADTTNSTTTTAVTPDPNQVPPDPNLPAN